MADMKFDGLMKRVRGKVGNYVFRKTRGRQFISSAPDQENPPPPTPPQLAAREQFRQASLYAGVVLADPAKRAVYEQIARDRNTLVRSLVVGDFLNPPVVEQIDLGAYHGHAGDLITIQATDDIEVVSVIVQIHDLGTNAVVEQGPAAKVHGVWVYTATVGLAPAQQVNVEVRAYDRPGHDGMQTRAYP